MKGNAFELNLAKEDIKITKQSLTKINTLTSEEKLPYCRKEEWQTGIPKGSCWRKYKY